MKCLREYLDLEKPSTFQVRHKRFNVLVASNTLFELSIVPSLKESVGIFLGVQNCQRTGSQSQKAG